MQKGPAYQGLIYLNQTVRMLDQLKDATAKRILSRFPEGQPVSRASLEREDVPENIRHFLLRTLDRRIELSIREAIGTIDGWFVVSDLATDDIIAGLVSTARKSAAFPGSEWKSSLVRAVDLVLSYTVEPIDTLVHFTFGPDSATISAADLHRRAGYFSDHTVVRQAVELLLEKRGMAEVGRQQLQRTLLHIYRQITEDYDDDQWIRALDPLVDLTAYAGFGEKGAPVEGVVRFFSRHGLVELAGWIHDEADRNGAVFIKLATVVRMLEEFEPSPEEEAETSEPVEAEPPAPRQTATETAASDSGPQDTSSPKKETETPLWKRFQTQQPASRPSPAERDDSAQPIWKRFREQQGSTGPATPQAGRETRRQTARSTSQAQPVPSEEAAKAPASGLDELEHRLLGDQADQRERYVRHLFNGDLDAYADALARIGQAPSWTRASQILAHDVFRKFSVDIYSDTAIDFTDALEDAFSSRPSDT